MNKKNKNKIPKRQPKVLTKSAFAQLLREDIDWLNKQPRTLEREHIEQILNSVLELYYD